MIAIAQANQRSAGFDRLINANQQLQSQDQDPVRHRPVGKIPQFETVEAWEASLERSDATDRALWVELGDLSPAEIAQRRADQQNEGRRQSLERLGRTDLHKTPVSAPKQEIPSSDKPKVDADDAHRSNPMFSTPALHDHRDSPVEHLELASA